MSKGNNKPDVDHAKLAELARVFRTSEALGLTPAEEAFAYELAGRLRETALRQSRAARKRRLVASAALSFALIRMMAEDAGGRGRWKANGRKRDRRGKR